jgi:hypothetical protein
MTKLDLTDPTAVLLVVLDALRVAGIDAAVYGGLALAAYGEPRETRDADVAVVGKTAAEGQAALRAAGLDAMLAFDRVTFGGNLVSRVTLVGDGVETSGLNTADFVEPRSERYARLALERAIAGTIRGETLRVLSPEDFIIFKLLSTRDRDLDDAVTVVRALGDRLSMEDVEQECSRLAVEIPDCDVAGRLATLRARASSGTLTEQFRPPP